MEKNSSETKRTDLQNLLHHPNESAFRKYTRLTCGECGIWTMLCQELRTMFFGSIPGALGIILRRVFYRRLFNHMGRNVVLGRGITIRHPSKISIGDNTAIDDFCVLDARGGTSSAIDIGEGTIIGRNTILRTKDGTITLGSGCSIGANCILSSSSNLSLGENALVASCAYILAGGQHSFERTDTPIIAQKMVSKGGVSIGSNSWLGARVTVLDGVRIGDHTIIGACSLVNKDVPPYHIAYGVPAKPVRDRRRAHTHK